MNVRFSIPTGRVILAILVLVLTSFSSVYAGQDAKAALSKMLQNYTNLSQLAVRNTTLLYETKDDKEPILVDEMVIWINGKEMYYKNDETEYYQNTIGSIWLNPKQKIARYVPKAQQATSPTTDVASVVNQQLETLIMLSDSMAYKGKSTAGKDIYTLFMAMGEYSKVEFHLNANYTLNKTVYYFKKASYGYKAEAKMVDLSAEEAQQIKVKTAPISAAIQNKTIESYYKNYQFLEIE